jgi:hypothetical protein
LLTSDDGAALLRAVLGANCTSDEDARRHLWTAAKLGMDPLDYCAHQFGLGNAAVWRRAAGWAGYRFADALPCHPALPPGRINRIDRLGETRSLRVSALGQDLTFISPTFRHVLNLAGAQRDELATRIRFAAPDAIEAAAARAASEQLMDYARQRTTQVWPKASAAADQPYAARVLFVALLALLVVLVMTAGLLARPVLVPIVALLLMAPGVLRLLAALPARRQAPPAPLPDCALPFYSVLIPLRDETQMVPLLKRAMSALDYPALCSKRTKGSLG